MIHHLSCDLNFCGLGVDGLLMEEACAQPLQEDKTLVGHKGGEGPV